MDNLFEGLKEGDLDQLVLPLISIDEYESKLDDDSIVIAFFVHDRDPAADLNRFIQKGAVAILDTDPSPAPNEDGFYLVFVEVLRDENFPKKTMDILGSLEGLTNIKSWRASIYDVDATQIASEELLASLVRLQSVETHEEEPTEDDVNEELTEFFRQSDLEGLRVDGRNVVLESLFTEWNLEFVDLGSFDVLQVRNAVLSQGVRLDEAAQHNVSRLTAMLGDQWGVEHLENHVLLSCALSEDVALFRLA